MKEIVQIIKIKMTSLIIYWVLLTEFINFLRIIVINFNESKKLLHEIENSKITYEEASKIIENIHSDIN